MDIIGRVNEVLDDEKKNRQNIKNSFVVNTITEEDQDMIELRKLEKEREEKKKLTASIRKKKRVIKEKDFDESHPIIATLRKGLCERKAKEVKTQLTDSYKKSLSEETKAALAKAEQTEKELQELKAKAALYKVQQEEEAKARANKVATPTSSQVVTPTSSIPQPAPAVKTPPKPKGIIATSDGRWF